MAKIGFSDIITLAKSGWTPDAVNATLDRLEKMNESDEHEDHEEHEEIVPDEPEEDVPEDSEDDAPDEKDLKIAQLEKQLQDAQRQNVHENQQSDKKSLEDMVDDIFKEFYD